MRSQNGNNCATLLILLSLKSLLMLNGQSEWIYFNALYLSVDLYSVRHTSCYINIICSCGPRPALPQSCLALKMCHPLPSAASKSFFGIHSGQYGVRWQTFPLYWIVSIHAFARDMEMASTWCWGCVFANGPLVVMGLRPLTWWATAIWCPVWCACCRMAKWLSPRRYVIFTTEISRSPGCRWWMMMGVPHVNVRNVRNVVPCLTIVIITVVSEKELRGWHNEQTNAVKNAPCELFCSLSSSGQTSGSFCWPAILHPNSFCCQHLFECQKFK